jgi:hypothetical protein
VGLLGALELRDRHPEQCGAHDRDDAESRPLGKGQQQEFSDYGQVRIGFAGNARQVGRAQNDDSLERRNCGAA